MDKKKQLHFCERCGKRLITGGSKLCIKCAMDVDANYEEKMEYYEAHMIYTHERT